MRGIDDEVLEVYIWDPGRKAEGTTRFIYENCDGLSNSIGGNAKLDKAKELIDNLEADVVAYNAHKINFSHKSNCNRMSQMFNGGEWQSWPAATASPRWWGMCCFSRLARQPSNSGGGRLDVTPGR